MPLSKSRPLDRQTMISLSNIFLDNTVSSASAEPLLTIERTREFQIHIGNMHIGAMNGRHLFLRISEGERIVCDFHGIAHIESERKGLFVAVEPGAYDYFTHLKPDEFMKVWEGDAEDLGKRLNRMVMAADRINENPPEYKLISVNCNSVLRTLLTLAEIDIPKQDGWTPGLGRKFKDIINGVKEQADEGLSCAASYVERFEAHIAHAEEEFKKSNLVASIQGFTHQPE